MKNTNTSLRCNEWKTPIVELSEEVYYAYIAL